MKNILITILLVVFSLLTSCGNAPQYNQKDSLNILIIGLDAASWKIIIPLLKKGKLPNIKRLMQEGVYGKLWVRPDVSPVIWTSIATGKSPEKHGIRDFFKYDNKLKSIEINKSYDRKVKAFWNILSEKGIGVGVFNWLVSQPPEVVNGFMVSYQFNRDYQLSLSVYPKNIKDLFPVKKERNVSKEKPFAEYGEILQREIKYLKEEIIYAVNLKKTQKVKLFAVYTPFLDIIQHYFWLLSNPDPLLIKEWGYDAGTVKKYNTVVNDSYIRIDGYIGELLKYTNSKTIVIVLSDHGFTHDFYKLKIRVEMKALIEKMGLPETDILECAPAENKQWWEYYIKTNLPEKQLLNLIGSVKDKAGQQIFNIDKNDDVEWKYKMRQVVTDVRKNDMIYINGQRYPAVDILGSQIPYKSGTHDYLDAVFIAEGKPIKKLGIVKDVGEYDITPTILYLMGLPVAKDMDGKVLTQIIDEEYLRINAIKYIPTYESTGMKKKRDGKIDGLDEEYRNRLKALGYVQ
jgi:predicted AlkP superfamily phosphohydrolase/phosphomutase